tara:strand:- start:9993 stop:10175 length:183 start_codon:yes stop_codon:yes gene_type:complete
MFDWLKRKDELEKLKIKYRDLMKRSFKLAVSDKRRSELARSEAQEVLEKIQYLKMKLADK